MIAGKVVEVDKRDWKNGIYMYHFKLEGSPKVHNCGTQDPRVEAGQCVRFKEINRKVDVNTIETITETEIPAVNGSGGESPSPSSSHTYTNSPSNGVAQRIQHQEARHDAIRLVCAAMENKLLPYPQSGKNEDKWSRLLDLINETTNDLIEMEGTWKQRS
jgi:hypothetical protein